MTPNLESPVFVGDYRIRLRFADGPQAEIDMAGEHLYGKAAAQPTAAADGPPVRRWSPALLGGYIRERTNRRATMTEGDRYLLGHRTAEQERLQRQAEQLAHEASWLLDQIGLAPGARVLEIGCGPRGCLDLLAARVGPAGSVVGVEMSEEAVALARALVEQRGLRNVEVLPGDARSANLAQASFDLVTARLVLVNVPSPEQVVSEAVALARPGGTVAFHEIDWAAMVCDPPDHAWTALVELFVSYTKRNGIDLFIGRKLPRLLRDAGLADVRVNPIMHVHPPGDARRTLLLDFAENLHERIVADNLIAETEFAALREGMRRHVENSDTLVFVGPYVQAWGRKPG